MHLPGQQPIARVYAAGRVRQKAGGFWKDVLTGRCLRGGLVIQGFQRKERICNKDMHSGVIYKPENWKQPKSPPLGLAWQIHAEEGMEIPGHVTHGEGEAPWKQEPRAGEQI